MLNSALLILPDDVYGLVTSDSTYQPSPVVQINTGRAEDYLERYAQLNSYGNVEPHADWNDLFDNQVALALGTGSYFDVVSSFWNDDYVSFTFENGSSTGVLQMQGNLDLTSFCTDPITNGADVYSCLVSLYVPTTPDDSTSSAPSVTSTTAATTSAPSATVSYTYNGVFIYSDIITAATSDVPSVTSGLATSTSTSTEANTAAATSWFDYGLTAFPDDPVVIQPELGISGFTTGYIISVNSSYKVGVLSIPTFQMGDEDVALFANTTARFIQAAKDHQVAKVVIDLQQNIGGLSLLALDTFKQFFPNIGAFAGSRLRAQRYADQIGRTLTPFGQTIPQSNTTWYTAYLLDPFAATTYLDASTNEPFENWQQLFGPHADRGDLFTTTVSCVTNAILLTKLTKICCSNVMTSRTCSLTSSRS